MTTKRSKQKTNEEIYQKKSPREHVLLRPDTYVGSVERDKEKMFILDCKNMKMEEKEVEYVPALYKIFDEILVNAADNKQRDPSMKEIRVKIDILNGCVSIKNDGRGIPIEIHKGLFRSKFSEKHNIFKLHLQINKYTYIVKNTICIFPN